MKIEQIILTFLGIYYIKTIFLYCLFVVYLRLCIALTISNHLIYLPFLLLMGAKSIHLNDLTDCYLS